MGKQKPQASPYCEMCAQAGHKRIAQAVINGHSVCGFHMCCLGQGEEAAWPIVSNWANCKWVLEFQQLLRPLLDPFLENKDQAIKAVYDYGVRMKLDPERLRRRERVWVAGRWVDRRETADEYARRVNSYLERFIAEEAVKIVRKRRRPAVSNRDDERWEYAMASKAFETARLIAALDERRHEIASKGKKTWGKSGELSLQAVDDCCSLFAAAGRLKDCGHRRVNGLWLRSFFEDVYRRVQAGDPSAARVAEVIDGFLDRETGAA